VPGEELRMPLTQPLIADATGLTPIHTNRMLGELRHRGIIDYGNGLFRILDPERLFEAAGIDPEMCPWSPAGEGADTLAALPPGAGSEAGMGMEQGAPQ
jgi:hypothetical protein